MKKYLMVIIFVLLINFVYADDSINVEFDKPYTITLKSVVEGSPLDKAYVLVNGIEMEMLPSQKREFENIFIIPGSITYMGDESEVNFTVGQVKQFSYEDYNLVFNINNKKYIVVFDEIIDGNPFDKAKITINGEQLEFLSAQKKVADGLTLIPGSVTYKGNDSMINVTVQVEKRLSITKQVMEDEKENNDDMSTEEDEENKSNAKSYAIYYIIGIIIIAVVIFFYINSNKKPLKNQKK